MWLFPHTCTYSHTHRWSVSHHSGSCTLPSRISIMEFVMSWSLLQLEVILAWDSWQTFCCNPSVLARGNKMPTMTTSAASCRGCFHPVNGFHFNAFYCLNLKWGRTFLWQIPVLGAKVQSSIEKQRGVTQDVPAWTYLLSTVFHSINSPDNSPFSHSVLVALALRYWSFQLFHQM